MPQRNVVSKMPQEDLSREKMRLSRWNNINSE